MSKITIKPQSLQDLSPEFESLLRKGTLSDMAPVDPKCLFSLGAWDDDHPIGVATAFVQPHYKLAELKSLSADASKSLLEEMERELAKQEIRMLTATFPSNSPIYQFLQSCQWEGPRIVMISSFFISHLFAPSWHLRAYRLPKGFAYFPWQQLTKEDKQIIQALWEKGDLSLDIYPFYEETTYQPNSLGLRYEGKIVGWSLAESNTPQSLWYSKLYIDPAWRTSGIAIQLLSASIQRHDHVRFPNVYFRLNLVQSSLRWLRFVKKRLIPYANAVTEYYQMWHKF